MRKLWKSKLKVTGGILDQLLANRGIGNPQSIADFLNPKYEALHDPFLLRDMDKAASRVKQALERQEQITIYADYDADAVTAAAVLIRFFRSLGHEKINYYIPNRYSEGYGVNAEAVAQIARGGTGLIITVDCGINANDSVKIAGSLGTDAIITDHHQPTGELPEAVAVVNPHREDDKYPFKDLTGVGVAFKLVQAIQNVIASEAKQSIRQEIASSQAPRNDNSEWIKWLLDLVAIGTVADCQSLLGENRIFVKWGIHVLQKTRWPGLRELLKVAGLHNSELDTYKIGFMIAPRINAAGRIEHANLALELLLTDEEEEARKLAIKLNELNRHRQELTEQVLSEAREQLAGNSDRKILLAAGENWPKGIVGLVAGKLTDEFYRPVLVLEKSQDEATGSARSIANFNIIEAISQSREILVKYGGHPMAAGFTLKSEHIEVFYKNLLLYAESALSEELLSPVIFYDAELTLDDVTPDLLEILQKFAPFGQGNPRPRFRINNLVLSNTSAIGNDKKHLRLYVGSDSGKMIQCIGFNMGFWAEKLGNGRLIDIICEPQWNEWNGTRQIQLKIVDLNFAQNIRAE
ncbi:MAG: single-stranded-DNA-specific exonuclease RecJ [Candidatus Doudnabacteria bacterium]|nr:single-stranded-DNA-specific exonuclease RecJ [Candidatus Doudnabacteria bacterium]